MGHPGQNQPWGQCQVPRRPGCGEPGLCPGSGRGRACVWLWHSHFVQGGSRLSAVQGHCRANSPSVCSCFVAPQLPSPEVPASPWASPQAAGDFCSGAWSTSPPLSSLTLAPSRLFLTPLHLTAAMLQQFFVLFLQYALPEAQMTLLISWALVSCGTII